MSFLYHQHFLPVFKMIGSRKHKKSGRKNEKGHFCSFDRLNWSRKHKSGRFCALGKLLD